MLAAEAIASAREIFGESIAWFMGASWRAFKTDSLYTKSKNLC